MWTLVKEELTRSTLFWEGLLHCTSNILYLSRGGIKDEEGKEIKSNKNFAAYRLINWQQYIVDKLILFY